MFKQQQTFVVYFGALVAVVGLICLSCTGVHSQDYDDENYGNQAGNNQGDDENNNYNGGYGANDNNYAANNMPNYQQQNVDSEGSNNQASQYQPQGGSDAEADYEADDGSAAEASSLSPTVVRVRRSLDAPKMDGPKLRVKRHGKYYIGPVYTYVKTDKHANFKWGVKHKVGKKHHG